MIPHVNMIEQDETSTIPKSMDQSKRTKEEPNRVMHTCPQLTTTETETELTTNITNSHRILLTNTKMEVESEHQHQNQHHREHPPRSPTCTSSYPSNDLDNAGAAECLSELKLDQDDNDEPIGFDLSDDGGRHEICLADFSDRPLHFETNTTSQMTQNCCYADDPSYVSSSLSSPRQDEHELHKKQRKGQRTVRFSSCLVTHVYTLPRTSDEEWHHCYYSGHELQRMLDDSTGNSHRNMRRPCIIAAEEEDLDF